MADCPSREHLERLLAESLENDEQTRIEAHVEQCGKCQIVLHQLTLGAAGRASALARAFREKTSRNESNPDTEAFFDRLKRMEPGALADSPEHHTLVAGGRQERVLVEGYEILEELGRGAVGVVYRARHRKLNRLVALKVILAGPHLSPEVRHRFRAEALTIARLTHANIVQVYDVGEQAKFPFLSLELIEGGNLADWMAGKPRRPIEAAKVIATLAKAVEYAHRQGVIHRDLKPGNVLLSVASDRAGKRELKITDFGIAKVLPQAGIADARMTQPGEILGTPAYMAPEQARGTADEICPATDVYSMGAMLYELLTGRPPFQGATPLDTLMQAAHQDPVTISLLVPRVPRDLETICFKCLEKDSARRYPTAAELAEDLGRFLKNEPVHARPVSWVEHGLRWVRRHQALAAAVAAVAFLLLVLTAISLLATAHFRKLEGEQRALVEEKELARGAAVAAQQREADLRQQAEKDGRELRQNLYFDQMNLEAQAAASPSGIGRVSDWLAPWAQGQPDLRNWEWFYLNGLCHRDRLTISGHNREVQDVTWSPDGQFLASGDSDGAVRIWAVADGREIRCLFDQEIDVRRVAWCPDGVRLAAASWDGAVYIWNVKTGEKLLTFPGAGKPLFSVAWSPDGNRLASAGGDQVIRIWDAKTGAIQYTLQGHTGDIHDIAWSPDGKRLASASADHGIRIWDTTLGRQIREVRGHVNFVIRVAWSPDGAKLASASNDSTAKIWDPSTGAELLTLRGHAMGVSAIAWSADGTRLATSSDDQTLKLWSATDGAELFTLRGHTQRVTSVVWSPDGTGLASSSSDATIKIWDSAAGAETRSLIGHTASIRSIAWSPDGRRLASGGADQTARIWNAAATAASLALRGHTGQLLAVAWSPDGTRLASAGEDQTIRLWNASDGSQFNVLHVDTGFTSSLSWSPDGQRLASGGLDHTIRIWDVAGGKQVQSFQGHTGNVCCVAWSPDGTRLATASADTTIRIWDPQTGRQTLLLDGQGGEVFSVAWSADGKRLASGGYDQTVKLWDSDTGALSLTCRGHTAAVTGVAWNSDGTRLASSSDDHTVKLWDTATGRETLSIDCHVKMVKTVAWNPDGLSLAAAGEGDNILIHDAAPGYVAARAPQYLPMLDRRLADDPRGSAELLVLRAEIEARQGDWTKAAADLQQYMASNKQTPWFTIGYRVAGPYPDDLHGSYAPEADPGTRQSADPRSSATSKTPVAWNDAPFDASGFLDFGRLFNHAEHISAYAMLRVYSPRQQEVAVLLGADDQVRLWLNGKMIFEDLLARRAVLDADAVPAMLSQGWNTMLARVVNVTGEHALYLRLSDAAPDLKRARDEAAKPN